MKLQMILASFFLMSVSGMVVNAEELKGAIEVTVSGLKNNSGVLVNLYAQADGFPDKPDKALVRHYIQADNLTTSTIFDKLPYGEYAIAVCHDENNNQACDTNFLGIPKEGVGVSNDAKGFMGPPRFKDAKFKLDSDNKRVSVTVHY